MGLEIIREKVNDPPGQNLWDQKNAALPRFKIVSQNVRSLNLSTIDNVTDNNKFFLKLNAILKLGADIVLLQDTRLSGSEDIFRKHLSLTKFGSYDCYINSSSNGRGTITLIKKHLAPIIYNIYSLF